MAYQDWKQENTNFPWKLSGESSSSEVNGNPSGSNFSSRSIRGAIGLAAAPTFAAMAVVSGLFQDELAAICSGGSGALPLTGMVWMYILMSVFHVGPWLRVLENQLSQKT